MPPDVLISAAQQAHWPICETSHRSSRVTGNTSPTAAQNPNAPSPIASTGAVIPQLDLVGTRQIPSGKRAGLTLAPRGQPADRRCRQSNSRTQELFKCQANTNPRSQPLQLSDHPREDAPTFTPITEAHPQDPIIALTSTKLGMS